MEINHDLSDKAKNDLLLVEEAKKGNEKASAKLDRSSFIFLGVTYLILVLYFVYRSL